MKKIFTFFAAMMLLVSSASAATIYCKVDKSWWTQDGAAVAIHAWNDTEKNAAFPGDRMTPVEGVENLWMFELEDKFDKCVFSRVNGDGDLAYWGAKTEDQDLPTEGNNLFTLLKDEECWDDQSCLCHGEWSKYEAAPEIEGDLVYLGVNLPTENRPADDQIEVVGTFQFNNGAIDLMKLNNGWFIYNNPVANDFPLFYAAADDTFKFRDKTNNNKVLCELVNGEWVQAIFKFGDDWYYEEYGYKGSDPCMWLELDLGDAAAYAWMEGMPEPEPAEPEQLFEISYENKWLNVVPADAEEPYVLFIQSKESYEDNNQGYDQEAMGEWIEYLLGFANDNNVLDYFTLGGPQKIAPNAYMAILGNMAKLPENEECVAFAFYCEEGDRTSDIEYLVFTFLGDPSEEGGEGEEGLSNTAVASQAVKHIVNGQLFIERGGKLFNAQGAQVK